MTHNIHINIGSNSGCRHALIERAAAAVASAAGGRTLRSDVIETEPWGFDSPNAFLNLGLMVVLDLPEGTDMRAFALSFLKELQAIERGIDPSPHRDASGAYIDRAIDIDLIAIDGLVMTGGVLALPHPRMHEREFVLRPMAQLDPEWRHPLLGQSAAALLSGLNRSSLSKSNNNHNG